MTKTRDAIRLARMRDISLLNDYANIIEDANRIARKRNRFVYEQSKIDSTAELVTSQRDPTLLTDVKKRINKSFSQTTLYRKQFVILKLFY